MASDNYYPNVSLLLHGDGANLSTTVTDSSITPSTLTAVGAAVISTTQFKFGTASIKLPGTIADYVSAPVNAAYDFGTGDFTIEAWVYFTAHTTIQTILGNYLNSTTGWIFQRRSDTNLLVFGNGDTQLATGAFTPADATWYHLAVSRQGTNLFLFANGVQVGATATNSASISGSTNPLLLSGINAAGVFSQPFNGFLDEVRITKGVGRYTANFTPPTAAFIDYMAVDSLLTASDSWTGVLTVVLDFLSSLTASDLWVPGQVDTRDAASSLTAADSWSNDLLFILAIDSSATASDSWLILASQSVSIDSAATVGLLTDWATAQIDTLSMDSTARALGDGLTVQFGAVVSGVAVWVVNIETGASSRYENFNYASLTARAGRMFATKADGVYVLEGDTDNGTIIKASIATGVTNFPDDKDAGKAGALKRLPAVYLGVAADKTMYLKIVTEGQERMYRTRSNNAALMQQRVDPGRGLRATYYSFEVYNSEGSDFDLDTLEFVPVKLSRRV